MTTEQTTPAPKDTIEPHFFFPSVIYTHSKPEFLEVVKTSANEALDFVRKEFDKDSVYPAIMSPSMIGDPRTNVFEQFIAESAYAILVDQGYAMQDLVAYVSELWCQEHPKTSSMDQHVHNHGVMISGFYFLEVPENGCLAEFHDPRPGKVQASLPEADIKTVTHASNSLYIKPKAGDFVFSNSWLPHSFTRNGSTELVKFIHFNVSVMSAPTQPKTDTSPAPVVV